MDGLISHKFENRGIKIGSSLLYSHHQINHLTLILNGVGVLCDFDIFQLTASA